MNRKTYFEMFVDGARDGWSIGIHALLPNLVMAFTLIKILEDTGALKYLGKVCTPIMLIFGVPGEAIMVLIAALLSFGGGIGVALSLLTSGTLNGTDITIIMPAIFLIGGQIQNVGRVLGVIGIPPRFYPLLWSVSVFNALVGMLIMRCIVK